MLLHDLLVLFKTAEMQHTQDLHLAQIQRRQGMKSFKYLVCISRAMQDVQADLLTRLTSLPLRSTSKCLGQSLWSVVCSRFRAALFILRLLQAQAGSGRNIILKLTVLTGCTGCDWCNNLTYVPGHCPACLLWLSDLLVLLTLLCSLQTRSSMENIS